MKKTKIVKRTNRESMVLLGVIILEILAPYINRGDDVLHKTNHRNRSKFSIHHHADIAPQN